MNYELVVIGGSLGGMRAVECLLSGLPPGFPIPVAVVLHRCADSSEMLRSILQRASALRVREVDDKEPVQSGTVHLAPPDYHLLVERGGFALSTEGPVSYARPSIDVLFETAADAYPGTVIGVILTGANHDGARGAARIKRRGGFIIAQDPATAECPVMPAAAIAAAAVDRTVTVPEIAPLLVDLCARKSEVHA